MLFSKTINQKILELVLITQMYRTVHAIKRSQKKINVELTKNFLEVNRTYKIKKHRVIYIIIAVAHTRA